MSCYFSLFWVFKGRAGEVCLASEGCLCPPLVRECR